MVTTIVTPSQVEADLAALLQRVQDGEEVIIARDGAPIAKIVPAQSPPANLSPRVPGSARGTIELLPGWDDPLTEEELAEFEEGPIFPAEPAGA